MRVSFLNIKCIFSFVFEAGSHITQFIRAYFSVRSAPLYVIDHIIIFCSFVCVFSYALSKLTFGGKVFSLQYLLLINISANISLNSGRNICKFQDADVYA